MNTQTSEFQPVGTPKNATPVVAFIHSYTSQCAKLELTEVGERKLHHSVVGWFPLSTIQNVEEIPRAVERGNWANLQVETWVLESKGILV